jgi:CRP-like cAMP-binding protein
MGFASSGLMAMPSAGPRGHVLEALEPRGIAMQAERNEEIVAQDETATHCYLIVTGCVRTAQLMEDGRRQVGEFLFAGDLFGWEALDTHDFSAEAVTPVTLRRYARRDVEALADQDRDVARRLREISARRARSGREHMVLLGRGTASERIAAFLLNMAERLAQDGRSRIELPMSRSDMGDYLGLTIETVCRRLTQLRHDGTIMVKGATIAIRDRGALCAADGGRVVH